ncbi:flagellar export chaperone FlgN [Actinophytocola xanthii]|uniref:Flagellar biosynthesis protein FlgN n=1 Tax=Actinophytocola xanthii TaxID=1912961 RepID=A0A1Q8CZ52_9PSEU|nr:flagellar export chaperone FlgN [Actinophytocola xanthii]OLF19639.1 flagellar biosynthesis protein FlgN [Actinophytocola xanthii]
MSVVETSTILWRQRELLSMLLFKLDVESLVLSAGRSRWLGAATYEVELVLEQVRENEVLRAIAVDELADLLGLPPGPSLADLTDALDEPWRSTFADHRKELISLSAEIDAAVRTNRGLLTSGQRAVQEALHTVTGSSDLYRQDGTTAPAGHRSARLFDEAI